MAKAGKSTSTSTTRKFAPDADAYIAASPKAAQPLLRQLRAAIKKAAPKAEERISYGIVGYFYPTRLIYFGGAEKHVALYPAGDAKGLEKYLYGASTLRFPLHEPLPRREDQGSRPGSGQGAGRRREGDTNAGSRSPFPECSINKASRRFLVSSRFALMTQKAAVFR